MSTGPRRILVTALLSLLVGLGVLRALFGGRRSQSRPLHTVEDPVRLPHPTPGRRRRLAAGLLLGLLLIGIAGIAYVRRDALFGPAPRPADGGSPLAILSDPEAGPRSGTGSSPTRTPTPPPEAGPRPGAQALGEPHAAREPNRQAAAPAPPALAPFPPAVPPVTAPSFDVVRVDPTGDAVVAGRAAPNSTVALLVDGKPVASAKADADGWFTLPPLTLPTGSSEVGLRATDAQGAEHRSSATVAVVVSPSRDAKPLIAVTTPDRPTVVLSQPDRPATGGPVASGPAAAPPRPTRGGGSAEADASGRGDGASPAGEGAPATGSQADADARSRDGTDRATRTDRPDAATAPKIVSIDAQEGGRLFVTARGAPGADLRLYLNDTLIAPATVGRDGTVTFTIGQGVKPGAYTVRLDLVDPATGKVRDRAEVPFQAPVPGRDDGVEYAAGPQDPRGDAGGSQARRDDPAERPRPPSSTGSLAANSAPGPAKNASEVYVPGIETARIVRGDSLWRISRRAYGEGVRYTLIYDANQDQIRDPDLIYPGQVFVLPGKPAQEPDAEAGAGGRRE
ncbi:LysM peptidoglycan-binding domain-containing protein [Methylobacterium aerolatum]|uniref:Nucleoid-associated protein YgaU n=1 Tax=Methylobacterium aerolatum TaxID=418708 RepID=A0ABU0I5V6_9HYPH|nr:LysM peptidoglycan-binding domain-containing protein [Methylobacterium aerolatum]MDQ0450003.1 nucleoid-associated protein YgaU [Methylobacterium aerolatum]GJD36851.1 hypothetical protein FMGBMHLM_3775 [Methylobacterium aerolatum]